MTGCWAIWHLLFFLSFSLFLFPLYAHAKCYIEYNSFPTNGGLQRYEIRNSSILLVFGIKCLELRDELRNRSIVVVAAGNIPHITLRNATDLTVLGQINT